MLLPGISSPCSGSSPQLRSFFHQHYLGGQEPTPGNIRVNEDLGPRVLHLTFCYLFLTSFAQHFAVTAPVETLGLLGEEGDMS